MTTPTDERKTFCGPKGFVLTLRPVSQFKIDDLRASNPEIPIPQYEMELAGGAKVNHPMDETIARNKGRLDEWNEYLERKRIAAKEQAELFSQLLISEGVDIEVPGIDSEWQKEMDHYHIKVPAPDHPIERKLKYIYHTALVGVEDVVALVSQILSVSQVSEEVVAKIRNSFRSSEKRNPISPPPKAKRKVAKH